MESITKGLRPTHPGEILRQDVLPALAISKIEFARRLRVSRQTLYDLLDEKQSVTVPMALRLGRLLGNGAEIWSRLQIAYDLATVEQAMRDELAQIEALDAA